MRPLFVLVFALWLLPAGLTAAQVGPLTPPIMIPPEPGDSARGRLRQPVRVAEESTPAPVAPIVVTPRPTNPAGNTGGITTRPLPPTTNSDTNTNANNGNGNGNGGTTGAPGNNGTGENTNSPKSDTEPTDKGPTVVSNFKVIDLAVGGTQEVEISNQGPVSYKFPSGQGVIAVQIASDGSLVLGGEKGQVDLQVQSLPLPMAGVMNEYQQLKIKGIAKFVVKKIDNKIFVSLRITGDSITLTYNDLTPDAEKRAKENYSFRFLIVGYPPVIIPNGKTLELRMGRDALRVKLTDKFVLVMSQYYSQRNDMVLLTGGSLKGAPISP